MSKEVDLTEVNFIKTQLVSSFGPPPDARLKPTLAQREAPLWEGSSNIVPEGTYPVRLNATHRSLLNSFQIFGAEYPAVQDFFKDLGVLEGLETRDDFYYALNYIQIVSDLRIIHWLSDEQRVVPVNADERSRLYHRGYTKRHQFHVWEEEMENSYRMTRERMMDIRELIEDAFEKKHSNVE